MIYQIFPKQDATLYERYPTMNTGIDALLEVSKLLIYTGSSMEAYTSRILMKFDYNDLDALEAAGFNTGSANNKYILKLYSTEEAQLPSSFTMQVVPISGSWNMGLGKYDYAPSITEGVSWTYKYSLAEGTKWPTSSFSVGTTGSWNINAGGGVWYTTSASKVIDYNELNDLEIDITNLVNNHLNSIVPNNGFMVKRPESEENSVADEMQLKFFSSDTNTIYLPHLKVCWNDWSWNTGSLTALSNFNSDHVISFKNLRHTYYTDEKIKFRLSGRPKYPAKTFATSSAYSYQYYLPASSSYSIEDLHTKETVISHDDIYTRISCDSTSNYFNIWIDSLQPERWYRFTIKSKYDNTDVRTYNDSYIFKVERRS